MKIKTAKKKKKWISKAMADFKVMHFSYQLMGFVACVCAPMWSFEWELICDEAHE